MVFSELWFTFLLARRTVAGRLGIHTLPCQPGENAARRVARLRRGGRVLLSPLMCAQEPVGGGVVGAGAHPIRQWVPWLLVVAAVCRRGAHGQGLMQDRDSTAGFLRDVIRQCQNGSRTGMIVSLPYFSRLLFLGRLLYACFIHLLVLGLSKDR